LTLFQRFCADAAALVRWYSGSVWKNANIVAARYPGESPLSFLPREKKTMSDGPFLKVKKETTKPAVAGRVVGGGFW